MTFSSKELNKVWGLVKVSLSKQFPANQYRAWIEQSTKLIAFEGEDVVVAVPNAIALKWVKSNAKFKVTQALSELLGTNVTVNFKVSPIAFKIAKPLAKKKNKTISMFSPEAKYSEQVKRSLEKANINPKYSFEEFIVGSNSQLAYAASIAVSEDIGNAYNPLFIYGPVGVGKTHLMQAIAHKVIQKNPAKEVFYCSSESFLNEMVDSIRSGKSKDFKLQYRKLDILLIDDIQFISSWQSTQDELFHTFNTLYNAGKQIIIASDRRPADINGLADRLRSRFEGGMVVDILPPDFETRVAILRKLNANKHIKLEDAVLEKIAMLVTDNVRSLIGAYNKIQSYAKLTKSSIGSDNVDSLLGVDPVSVRKRLTPNKVLTTVASEFRVSVDDLKSKSRSASVVLPRQISMYLIRELMQFSLEETARVLNRKDHTTVLHAINKVHKVVAIDENFKRKVMQIKGKLIG